jgi:hypothetical protein
MRSFALSLLIAATLAASCAAEDTVAGLKARLDSALPDEKPAISIRIAQLDTRSADRLYNEGRVEEARALLDEIVAYTEKARDFAIQSKKRLKDVEIDTRKISEKLRDIKRTLAFEDQAPVEQTIRHLEDIRTALLKEMFSKREGKK